MIFATVGTNETPFDRLVHACGELARGGEEVIIQTGSSSLAPHGATTVGFASYERILGLMGDARVVVSHAGVGSIMSALSVGARPIVMPRLHRFGEAVDDHQLEVAERLASAGLLEVVGTAAELAAAASRRGAERAPQLRRQTRLTAELGRMIASELDDPARSVGPRRSP